MERAAQIAREFLEVNGSVFGVKDIARELVMVPVEQDRYGFSHVNFFQVHEGVEVIGGALYVHLNRKGEVTSVNGKFAPELMLSTMPAIEKEHAVKLAIAQAQADMQTTDSPLAKEPQLVVLPLGFIHNERDDNVHLAWKVNVDEEASSQSVTYYLDATMGATLIGLDNVRHIQRRIYECAGSSTFNGCVLQRSEGQAPVGPCQVQGFAFGSNDVDTAYAMALVSHNYASVRYGLNGANNLGGVGNNLLTRTRTTIRVHVDIAWPPGCTLNPPITNGRFNGGTGIFDYCLGPLLPGLFGHEYGHAIQYSAVTDINGNPTGLLESGESWVISESGADIWGIGLEVFYEGHTDWVCFSRNLHDPTDVADPFSMVPYPDREYSPYTYCLPGNSGHHNSTILSHAFYLMSDGGEHNGCEMDSIGLNAVEQILYRATAQYYTYTETFADAVNAFQQSCIDLYDATHPEYLATVTAALQAVEMDQPGLCSGIPEVAPACAVHGAGVVSHDTTVYLGQNTVVNGTGGLAEREVTFYLSAHPAVDTIWAPINIYREVMNRDTVELDGSLQTNAWLADTLGVFDIIVDENSDGFFQPWADTILTVQVIEMPASLDLVTVQLNDHELRFHWKQISSSANYVLEHDDNFDFATPDTVVITSDTTATDSVNVLGSETGFYRVRVE